MKRTLFVVAIVALALGSAPARSAWAQSSSIGLISALVGKGFVTHAVYTEPAPLRLEDAVFLNDRIETKEQSVARVLFGGRITVTIRERSIVTITDDPTHPRVDLESGTLAFKVHPNGLRPGEVAEIRTPNAITGIRGSLVVAEVTGTADQPDSNITVLEAHAPITVASRDTPTQTILLRPGQRLRVSGPRHRARLGIVRHLSHEEVRRAAETAEVPGRPHDGGQERRYERRAQQHTALGGEGHAPRWDGQDAARQHVSSSRRTSPRGWRR